MRMKKTKANKILLLTALLILLIITMNCASAIGVTPGKATIPYPDGLDKTFSFTVLDSEDSDGDGNENANDGPGFEISTKGELGKYIEIDNSPASLYPYRESNKFYYQLNMNDSVIANLTPGEHLGEIVIRKKVDDEIFAVAIPSVVHQVVFFVPYPAKYLQSRIEILEADKNETTEFLIPIVNLGEEKIEGVFGNITIYDKQGAEILGNVVTNLASLETMERKDLNAEWENTVDSNIYLAEIKLMYDDEAVVYHEYFKVGKVFLDVSDILIENFELGNIVTFHLLADNQWGEDLNNIYASMKLYGSNGNLAYEVKSPVTDIKAYERKRIPVYWDTTGVEEGTYHGKLIVYYDLYHTEKNLYVEIFDKDIRIQIQEGEFALKTPSYKRLIFILSLAVLAAAGIVVFKKITKKK